jgi:hypothetical protein
MVARRGATSWLLLPFALVLGSAGWFALRSPAVAAAELPASDSNSPPAPETPPLLAVTKGEIAVALLRAHLTPVALASAGVNASGVEDVIETAGMHLSLHASDLATADASFAAARVQVDALQRKTQSGIATQEEVAQLATAKTSLAQAEAARVSAIDALIAYATAHLSSSQRATLATIRANSGWALPTEYLAENRQQADWVLLRDALANQKISAKYSEVADSKCQGLLAVVHGSQATSSAKANKESLLATAKATWATALE